MTEVGKPSETVQTRLTARGDGDEVEVGEIVDAGDASACANVDAKAMTMAEETIDDDL